MTALTEAERYNLTRISRDQIEPAALTAATRITQAALGLAADGMFGPLTAAALAHVAADPLAAAMLDELGHGEAEADNAGPDIARYFDDPYIEGRSYGEWCAALVSRCALRAGLVPQGALSRPARLGARRLTTRLAELGSWIVMPREAATFRAGRRVILQAGDAICHYRGLLAGWQGHIGVVLLHHAVPDDLVVVDGNSEPFPARVRIRVYRAGAWRARLWGVARLQSARQLLPENGEPV
jgi:hypothetical protein